MNLRRRRLWAALESHCKHNTRRLSKGIGKAPAVAANFASALRRRSGPRGYFGQHLCSPLSLGSVLLACWIPILHILLHRSGYLWLGMHCNVSYTACLGNCRSIEDLSACPEARRGFSSGYLLPHMFSAWQRTPSTDRWQVVFISPVSAPYPRSLSRASYYRGP